MLILQFTITFVLLGMSAILLLNWWSFPRLQKNTRSSTGHEQRSNNTRASSDSGTGDSGTLDSPPLISLLVPARNEAAVIGETVKALLGQSYAPIELLVLDDHSTDGTTEIAGAAAAGDRRLRVLAGEALPPGWLGKNWACHQLAQAAIGEILVFTDADVRWSTHALDALAAEIEETGADLFTVWPTQETITWGERLVVPLMALVVHAYLPVLFVHHIPHPIFAAANGQCIAFRRRAYEAVGGHASVRDNVLEDVSLARRAKRQGLRLRMAEGNHLVSCRMYRSWIETRNGYAKNILKGYGSAAGLLAATLFHWMIFLGPWLLLLLGGVGLDVPGWPLWPLALALWGIGLRGLTALHSQQRLVDALLMPISVLLMTRIAAQALWWQWRYGGPVWKGRVVRGA
jgi:chlorobactene glucosyltransferase